MKNEQERKKQWTEAIDFIFTSSRIDGLCWAKKCPLVQISIQKDERNKLIHNWIDKIELMMRKCVISFVSNNEINLLVRKLCNRNQFAWTTSVRASRWRSCLKLISWTDWAQKCKQLYICRRETSFDLPDHNSYNCVAGHGSMNILITFNFSTLQPQSHIYIDSVPYRTNSCLWSSTKKKTRRHPIRNLKYKTLTNCLRSHWFSPNVASFHFPVMHSLLSIKSSRKRAQNVFDTIYIYL